MKIAINALAARFGGGVAYIRNLLESLQRIDHENEYIIFSNPERAEIFRASAPNFRTIVPRFPGKAIIRRTFWEQLILPSLLKRQKVDILFSPGGIAPLIVPKRCRRVNIVQNMAPFSDELMESYPFGMRKIRFSILRRLYPFFAGGADFNIFISTDGLNKLSQVSNFDKKNTEVIYHGRNEIFEPVSPTAARDFARKNYDIGGEFVLYVSNIARYKKQLEVIEAYHLLRKRSGAVQKLVLAGIMVEPSYYREILSLVDRLGLGEEIMYLGQVPQDHLPFLYSAAAVFAFASIAENCPNILIEAMACGAPIVSSNVSPMPEICKNAAIYFDPFSPADISEKMYQVLTGEAVRQELMENARANVRHFSWDKTARKTLEVFRRI